MNVKLTQTEYADLKEYAAEHGIGMSTALKAIALERITFKNDEELNKILSPECDPLLPLIEFINLLPLQEEKEELLTLKDEFQKERSKLWKSSSKPARTFFKNIDLNDNLKKGKVIRIKTSPEEEEFLKKKAKKTDLNTYMRLCLTNELMQPGTAKMESKTATVLGKNTKFIKAINAKAKKKKADRIDAESVKSAMRESISAIKKYGR